MMFSENEEYIGEELEETEEFEDSGEEKPVWCYGEMDEAEDEEFMKYCVSCDLYYGCFKKTYDETVFTWKTRENIEFSERDILEIFLKKLSENKPSFLKKSNIMLKPHKLIKIGKLSVGVSIPASLNMIFPLGSDVLTVWIKKAYSILFFGVKSYCDREFIEKLRILGKSESTTFRRVNQCGKLNVLLIPRQYMCWFNTTRKVVPKFSNDYSVLFFRSNLTDNELNLLEEKMRSESFHVRHNVVKAVSPRLEWVVEGSCSQCGRIGKLYNGKSGLICSQCLKKEREGLF